MTEISALSLKSTPASDDEIEIQETGGGASKKITPAGLDSSSLTGLIADNITWSGTQTYSAAVTFHSTITQVSTDAGAGVGPTLTLYRNSASPAASDLLADVIWQGEDSAGSATPYARMRGFIVDPTDASEAGRLQVLTLVGGSTGVRAYFSQGFVVGNPTGDDAGVGIVNAVEVQDDGVTLTDYPFDAYLDGSIDIQKYDDAVPDRKDDEGRVIEVRQHEAARAFDMAELEPSQYMTKAKTLRQLPAIDRIPASANGKKGHGRLLQALMETCEVQAIHIEKLEARIAALESV